MVKKIFDIKGIHCKSCIKLIESELQDKVNEMKIEENGSAFFDFDERTISEKDIKRIIKNLGYKTI